VSALKLVGFDHRSIGEDHDAGYRAIAYFGAKGILDPNMLCQEREAPDCASHQTARSLGNGRFGNAPHFPVDPPLRVLLQVRGIHPHLEPALCKLQLATSVHATAVFHRYLHDRFEVLHVEARLRRHHSFLDGLVRQRRLRSSLHSAW